MAAIIQEVYQDILAAGVVSKSYPIFITEPGMQIVVFWGPGNTATSATVDINGTNLKTIADTTNTVRSMTFWTGNVPVGAKTLTITNSGSDVYAAEIIVIKGGSAVDDPIVGVQHVGAVKPRFDFSAPEGSLVVDFVNCAGVSPGSPSEYSTLMWNDTNNLYAGSYTNIKKGDTSIVWASAVANAEYTAVLIYPANAVSTWSPSLNFRTKDDVTRVNNLNSQSGTPPEKRYGGYFQTMPWKNSFLHTVGRTVPSAQNGPYLIKNFALKNNRVIISSIVRGGSVTSLNHTVGTQYAAVVVMVQAFAATTLRYNGKNISALVDVNGTNTRSQIYYIPNPPVGSNTVTVSQTNSYITIFTLLNSLIEVSPKTYSISAPANGNYQYFEINTNEFSPSSLIIDGLRTNLNGGNLLVGDGQIPVVNMGNNNGDVSYTHIDGPSTVFWKTNGGYSVDYAYTAIVIKPRIYPSLWYPNLNSNTDDSLFTQGNVINANYFSRGPYSNQFYKNSFLHTIGRYSAGFAAQGPPPPAGTDQYWRNLMGVGV